MAKHNTGVSQVKLLLASILVSMGLRSPKLSLTRLENHKRIHALSAALTILKKKPSYLITHSGGNNFSSSMVPRKPNNVLICSDVVLGDTLVTWTTFVV